MVFKNLILRPTILYGCETYYNLTEVRQFERIEENFLRIIFKTSRSCPISQIYLESAEYPIRFEIMKRRVLFLRYILNQEESSTIFQFLNLQIENPTRGDWASTVQHNLKELQINSNFKDIKRMSIFKLKSLLREKIKMRAFKYLTEKRNRKGQEVEYLNFQRVEYLEINEVISNIDVQQIIFQFEEQDDKDTGKINAEMNFKIYNQ